MADPTFFATTRWTLVRDAARGGDTLAVEALGSLLRYLKLNTASTSP